MHPQLATAYARARSWRRRSCGGAAAPPSPVAVRPATRPPVSVPAEAASLVRADRKDPAAGGEPGNGAGDRAGDRADRSSSGRRACDHRRPDPQWGIGSTFQGPLFWWQRYCDVPVTVRMPAHQPDLCGRRFLVALPGAAGGLTRQPGRLPPHDRRSRPPPALAADSPAGVLADGP
jgi:hypothetical protein